MLKKNFWFSVTVVMVIIFNIVLANQIEKTTPENAAKMQSDKSAVIVDARETTEQGDGRVKGAISLPLSIMEKNAPEFDKLVAQLPKNKTIIVYCRSGKRSAIVGEALEKRGFKVLNMGSFNDWKTKGLPTE